MAPTDPAPDPVHKPAHYQSRPDGGGFEFIDVAEAFGLGDDAYLFNVLKYILRARRKGEERQDLAKALNYLHRRVTGRWLGEAAAACGAASSGDPPGVDKVRRLMRPLYYLATPYSDYAGGLAFAMADAARLAGRLLTAGHQVYSPIAHSHMIAVHGGIDPLDREFWLAAQAPMMRASDALLVAHMAGWLDSRGVRHEIAVFGAAGKPVFDLDVETLAMTRREPARAGMQP